MKKLSLLTLLLMLAGMLAAKEYKVSTAHDFIKALGSDRTITVSGVINLSDVMEFDDLAQKADMSDLSVGSNPTKQVNREGMFDGHQLVLDQCKNLIIQGTTPVRDKDLPRIVPIAYSFQCALAVPRAYSRRNSMQPMPHRDS